MDFFDGVVNKSNAMIKERLNNPFGQKQGQQQQQLQEQQGSTEQDSTAGQAQKAAGEDILSQEAEPQATSTTGIDGQDKNSQFAAIAADAEAVAQKAAKGAQKFGTFLFSMANKAGQTVTKTAKQVKQAVESTSILTDFTREQQEFIREHGGSMQAAELPWASYIEVDKEKANYIKEQILSLSQDKRNFVRSPPQNADYKFEAQACYPIALSLLKEDPNLSKMRYELVPKLVNEDTFWCNYLYRVEMLKQESDGRKAGWASSRSSSGEGPDEVTTGCHSTGGGSQSIADEPLSPNFATKPPRQDSARQNYNLDFSQSDKLTSNLTQSTIEDHRLANLVSQQQAESLSLSESSSDPTRRIVAEADDLKNRLRELNIGSFESGGQDGAKDELNDDDDDDDEWDEELQREFELVSGDLSGLEDDDELKNDLLELQQSGQVGEEKGEKLEIGLDEQEKTITNSGKGNSQTRNKKSR